MARKFTNPGANRPAVNKALVKPAAAAAPKSAKIAAPVAKAEPMAPTPVPFVAASVEIPPVAEMVAQKVNAAADASVETVVETVSDSAPAVRQAIKNNAASAAQTVSKGSEIMEATIEKTQAIFADINDRTKAQVEKSTKLVAEAAEFAKGNVEALVESGKIAAKGFETLGQDIAEYNRKSFESATATLKSMSSVKSPADFFKLQSDFIRQSFDGLVAETSKNSEAMLKLAGEAAQPLSSRVAVAVEKAKVAA